MIDGAFKRIVSLAIGAGASLLASPVASATAPAINQQRLATVLGMLNIDDKGYFFSPAKWPTNAVGVCWEPGAPDGPEKGWVQDAVTKSWQTHSKLRFVPGNKAWGICAPNAGGIRIAIRDVSANDGPHTSGLGTQINGLPSGMVLNFTFKTWSQSCASSDSQREKCIRSIAVHEFGHAIGFAHEQNRADTPGECTEQPQGPNGDVMLTPWDLHSVMNYCNPVYNNDGQLSAGDIYSVQKIYGS